MMMEVSGNESTTLFPSPPYKKGLDVWKTKVVQYHRNEYDGVNEFIAKIYTDEVRDLLRHFVTNNERNWDHGEDKGNRKDEVENQGDKDSEESVPYNYHKELRSFPTHGFSPF